MFKMVPTMTTFELTYLGSCLGTPLYLMSANMGYLGCRMDLVFCFSINIRPLFCFLYRTHTYNLTI